jgi:hypothetical protein
LANNELDLADSHNKKNMLKRLFIQRETRPILKNIKEGNTKIQKARILIEDLNGEILLALEISAASKKIKEQKGIRF